MHMADALISPAVGGTMWTVSAGLIAWCARQVRQTRDDRLIPMMGVLGAFIFTAQMINFSIPVTGSSGHLGGGLVLAILLGPTAAFLVIASVLTVQALFFADGGLLALGCNIFNLGFAPAFMAYPLLYKLIAGNDRVGLRAWSAAVVAAIAGLQLGAFGVVLETTMSGISELPFTTFVLVMQPIHLAIGIVEGLATAAVVAFVAKARPESLQTPGDPLNEAYSLPCGSAGTPRPTENQTILQGRAKPPAEPGDFQRVTRGLPRSLGILAGFLLAAILLGGIGSWFASTRPDGLEWSIEKVTGVASVPEPRAWPAVDSGTSLSGLAGGALTLAVIVLAGLIVRKLTRFKNPEPKTQNPGSCP